MTCIKITDPKQREALSRELQDTKRKIQAINMQHRLDKVGLSEVCKPVVEAQREEALKIIKTIEDLSPPPAEFSDPLPIAPATDTVLGPLAQQYLKLGTNPEADHTFGLRVEDNTYMIANSAVEFSGDDIFADGVRYEGTPGIWELMVKKRPDKTFEPEDLDRYAEIFTSNPNLT